VRVMASKNMASVLIFNVFVCMIKYLLVK